MPPTARSSAARAPRGSKSHRPYAPRMAAEQRREHLLDAALKVIVAQGYGGVSVEAIARTAGVTRPVVYDHFRDLGQLLHALNEREVRYSIEQLEHLLPDDPNQMHPADVLAGSVARFLDAVAARPATWTLILLPLEGTPELVRRHVEANRAKMLARMEAAVRWAIERTDSVRRRSASPQAKAHPGNQGDAAHRRRAVDVELAARAILGLAEDAGRMVLTDPERYSPERYEQFVHWVMKLIWPD